MNKGAKDAKGAKGAKGAGGAGGAKGGRPRLGKEPMSATERKRRSLAKHLEAGGSTLSVSLAAAETKALASGMKKAGIKVKRAYVAYLLLKHR